MLNKQRYAVKFGGMKNEKTFFAKQGFLSRIFHIVFNVIVPVSLFTTLIIYGISDKRAFALIAFISVNLLWIIRNSIIVADENEVIMRNSIGGKVTVNIKNSTVPNIITTKEYNKLMSVRTGTESVITNCYFFPFTKKIKLIHFKNYLGHDVVIGVYNVNALYDLIKKNSTDDKTRPISVKFPEKRSNFVEYYHIKTTPKGHIETYLLHFPSTIILSLVPTVCYYILFKTYGLSLNLSIFILIFLYILTSLYIYSKFLRVAVDRYTSIINLKIFENNEKNVIYITEIQSITYDEIDDFNGGGKSPDEKERLLIKTPEYDKLDSEKVHIVTPYCNIYLSVRNAKDLYESLK